MQIILTKGDDYISIKGIPLLHAFLCCNRGISFSKGFQAKYFRDIIRVNKLTEIEHESKD